MMTYGMQAMGSSASAMALDLLKDIKDDDHSRLQLVRDSCATAFVGKIHGGG